MRRFLSASGLLSFELGSIRQPTGGSHTPQWPFLGSHGLTVKETAFESLPPHVEVEVGIPPIELEDVPPGGLSTKTGNVPGCAMLAAGIVATN